jgi:hypothetical protein
MRGKGGELLFQLRALAGRALRLFGTVNDGFEFLAALFADVFKNRHHNLQNSAARQAESTRHGETDTFIIRV